jgi:MscS family membrane protein
MQRLLLFLTACGFASILIFPLLAEDESKTKPAPTPSADAVAAKETVDRTVDKVEDAVKAAAGSINAPVARKLSTGVGAFLRADIFGYSVAQLTASFLIFIFSILFRNIISKAVIDRILRYSDRSSLLNRGLVVALSKPFSAFLVIFGFYLAILVLPISPFSEQLVANLFRGLSMLTLVWAAFLLSDLFAGYLEIRLNNNPQSAVAGFAPLIRKCLKVFVLIIGILMTIDNLGYNVTGIIATLGLGTAAVALAAQDTIKNAFGAMMIALDRPFKVGDWIQVGDKVDGNVEAIGLRSTKVRTFPKTVVSIPNGVLANEYINNWSRMPKRRVKQVVGVSYEASAVDMEGAVEDIRKILRNDDDVDQEFILVNFTNFGDSSLDILVYYGLITWTFVSALTVKS